MKYLIVVDMQNDFIDGALGTAEAAKIVDGVAAKVQNALTTGVKVMFTQDTHPQNYLETQEGRNLPVKHCVKGGTSTVRSRSLPPIRRCSERTRSAPLPLRSIS